MVSEERIRLFIAGCICLTDDEILNMSKEQKDDIVSRFQDWDELNRLYPC